MGVAAGALAPSLISAGGAILGGVLANKGSKQAGNTNVTQTSVPWAAAQPYITRGFSDAQGILDRGYQYDPALVNQSKQLGLETMRGDYLNSNPFQTGAIQDAMNMARTQINSQFGGNNYGSSAHQEWLGRGLMNASLPYLSQNYENERGRQYAAMAQAPALFGLEQQQNFLPWDFLGRYQGIVSGLNPGGGTTSTQTPYFSNPYSGAIGGAMLANQLYQGYQTPQLAQEMVPGQFSLGNPAYG